MINPFTHNVVMPKEILEIAEKRRNAVQQTKTVKMTEKQFQELVHNRVAMYLLPKYLTDNMQMNRVDMPAETVKKKGMCYRVYAVWLRDRQEMLYYTFENTEEGKYIGRILPDGKHELIEAAPDNGAEIEAVMNLAEAAAQAE